MALEKIFQETAQERHVSTCKAPSVHEASMIVKFSKCKVHVSGTSCNAQLANILQNACVVHVLPAMPTPLSVGHVLRVVLTVVIVAHIQPSTPTSLVPWVTKDTHLLNSWTEAVVPSLVI